MIGMTYIDLSIDEEFSKIILDRYSEMTGLSVVFSTDSGKPIYSDANWPVFCQEIYKIIGTVKARNIDYLEIEKKLYPCCAGLWCYSHPIKVDWNKVGTFVVGYRRIRGREEESKKLLEQKLSEHKVNNEDSNRLRELLENVDAIDEDAFNIPLLEGLSFIEQFVIIERQRAIVFKEEAASLAHEFLLPIQSVIANAENLFNETEEGSELKDIAEDILQQVTKLYFIAENIRGSVLEERDKFGYEFHQVDIYPIIIDTIKLFQKEAKRKGVIIKDPDVKYPSSFIEISKPHVERVFFNLIHNAVKYSFTGTKRSERYITVVCKPDRKFYCAEITNYGVGIKPEEISEGLIFKDGYRGILARDRSRMGSGFGLGTVKRIVEAHNGCVKVESKQVGTGSRIDPYKTTITVCIPFHQPRRNPHGNKNDTMDRR
jgi:signal transduction histidine kinase